MFVEVERTPNRERNEEARLRCRLCMEAVGMTKKEAYAKANKVKQRCDGCASPTCTKHSLKVTTLLCNECR